MNHQQASEALRQSGVVDGHTLRAGFVKPLSRDEFIASQELYGAIIATYLGVIDKVGTLLSESEARKLKERIEDNIIP